MINYTLTDNTDNNWRRVDKRTARRYYELDKPVILCPHKMNPFGPWGLGLHINRSEYISNPFDYYVKQATYYNCVDKQTGLYLSYYIKV